MAGTIFIRERRKVETGEKKPRFRIVAVSGAEIMFKVKHARKQEIEQIAQTIGAEVVLLQPKKGAEAQKSAPESVSEA